MAESFMERSVEVYFSTFVWGKFRLKSPQRSDRRVMDEGKHKCFLKRHNWLEGNVPPLPTAGQCPQRFLSACDKPVGSSGSAAVRSISATLVTFGS